MIRLRHIVVCALVAALSVGVLFGCKKQAPLVKSREEIMPRHRAPLPDVLEKEKKRRHMEV
jgi:hypothetical protein